jgi:indole-3-glycerol phosphate synthase/phosphoribosylanthranilate isomerase
LVRLAAKVRAFGMTPFIEVREPGDVAKFDAARKAGITVAGVNARDLATFKIDPLVPATMRTKLPCKTVFESGASTPGACRFARQLGFDGILIGEAAARNPEAAGTLVSAFLDARPDWVGQFWREIGKKIAGRPAADERFARRPLVKICGITNAEDALLAASLGADMLGFIFAPSPRAANEANVREIAAKLEASAKTGSTTGGARPLLVGVIVDPEGDEAKPALALATGRILDAIQYHGENGATDLAKIDAAGGDFGIGRYVVVRLGSEADLARIDELAKNGEPRVLVDARVDGIAGGTGKTIPKSLVRQVSEKHGLWLAGGINPSNVRQYIDEFSPELIDASSGLESAPGKKDHVLVKSFFREIAG